jgi:hypothetical protein
MQWYIIKFELDYSTEGDFDDSEYKICQFCNDTNKNGTMIFF